MLLRDLDLLFRDPATFFLRLALVSASILVGITIHEFSHALTASLLGDTLARRRGRLTLNPMAHLDPMGTALLFLAGFGWGKPVPVNVHALRLGRRGMALVAAAGPGSNLLAAVVVALPLRLGPADILASFLASLVFYNLILAVFNLLPVFPLDGSQVVQGLLPASVAPQFARVAAYGPALLILVIAVDWMTGWGILWGVLGPVVNYLSSIIVGPGL